ncbi:MAG: hypothetical protein GY851_03380 [bacterium]|nr:hypothetical protein [bacterium]
MKLAPLLFIFAVDAPTADPMIELAKYGAMGVLLGWFVYWSRKDKVRSEQNWEKTNEKMFGVIKDQTEAAVAQAEAVKKQTRVIEKLSHDMRERPCLKKQGD